MKLKKIIIPVGLLILVLLTGFYITYKGTGLLNQLKTDYLADLEASYGIELGIEEVNFWPINKISLKEVTVRKGDKLSFSIPEVDIYINPLEIVRRQYLESVSYIKIKEPSLILNQDFIPAEGNKAGLSIEDITENTLLKKAELFSDLKVYLEQGSVSIQKDGSPGQLLLEELSGLMTFSASSGSAPSQIDLQLMTGLKADNITVAQSTLTNLALDKLTLSIQLTDRQWSGKISSGPVNLGMLFDADLLKIPYLDLEQVQGSGQALVEFKGRGAELDEYAVKVDLTNGTAGLSIKERRFKEKIDRIDGEVFYYSATNKLNIKELDFNISGNPYHFAGLLDLGKTKPQVNGQLSSGKLDLAHPGFNLGDHFSLGLAGQASFDLIINGELFNPELGLELEVVEGQLQEEEIDHLQAYLRYSNGLVYVDDFTLSNSLKEQLALSGVFNSRTEVFNFEVEGADINLALLEKYLSLQPGRLRGTASFDLIVSGDNFSLSGLGATGNLEINYPRFDNYSFDKLQAGILLADQQLIVTQGEVHYGQERVNYSGDLDLTDLNLDIAVRADQLDTRLINEFSGQRLAGLEGTAALTASVSSTLSSPLIEIKLTMEQGSYQNYLFNDLYLLFDYQNKNIDIKSLMVGSNDAEIKGKGFIDLVPLYPHIAADISVTNLQEDFLEKLIERELPFKGSLNGDLKIRGPLYQPEVSGEVSSKGIALLVEDSTYHTDKLNLAFQWERGRGVIINDAALFKGETELAISGQIIESKFDLDYQLKNFELADIRLQQQIAGKINLAGRLIGEINNPRLSGILQSEGLTYLDRKLGIVNGPLFFEGKSLQLEGLDWQTEESNYKINGKLSFQKSEPVLDMRFKTSSANLEELIKLAGWKLPLQLDYKLVGETAVRGPLNNLSSQLDLSVYDRITGFKRMTVKGRAAEELNLELTGNMIDLKRFSPLVDRGVNPSGRLSFAGRLKGSLDRPVVSLKTKLEEAVINQVEIAGVTGQLNYNQSTISLQQLFTLADKSSFKLAGDIGLEAVPELDLQVDAEKLPLKLLSAVLPSFSIEGFARGNVRIKGNLHHPELEGSLALRAENFEAGLPEKIGSLTGDVDFAGQVIKFTGLTGRYGNGSLVLSGQINPLDKEQAWDVFLRGEGLPFAHGSFAGDFDPVVKITGPLATPLLSGTMLVHDFVVSMPFSWPKPKRKMIIIPEVDLTLFPGENVYFRNEHIDVIIQEGLLQLLYLDHNFSMEGDLSSRQGSFDYYNNKFILEKGEAVFRKYKGYIPDLHLKARTMVNGSRITVQVDGPANNMMMTFTSQPAMTEEEILEMLTSKGGIGQLINGSSGVFGIIGTEIVRFLRETLQFDFIDDLEMGFKEIFELDRMEIDTYDLGWNRELTFYLGKNITDRLYLQYMSTINPEEKSHELFFQYSLKDNSYLEGGWYGDDDYRLSIETSLNF